MAKEKTIIQIGTTTDGKPTIENVFCLYGTHGIPLELILDVFKTNGLVIDWVSYIYDALDEGHNPKTIRERILAAVGDVYGRKYREQIEIRFDKLRFAVKDYPQPAVIATKPSKIIPYHRIKTIWYRLIKSN